MVPSDLRQGNVRRVIRCLLHRGPMSRAMLARASGVSAVTMGKVVEHLLERKILETLDAGEPVREGPGRPSQLVQLNQSRPSILAIELGVRMTNVSALPVAGPGDGQWQQEFITPRTAADWHRRLLALRDRLALRHPDAVAVSVPGVLDADTHRVLLSPNLHWTEKADLPALVRQVWKAPVLLVQEIQTLALGQLTADPVRDNFLLVDMGFGLGAAAVLGGKLYAGPLPLCGELGHIAVRGNKRPCGCGGVGCVETLASEPGLIKTFHRHHPTQPGTWPALLEQVTAHGVEPWLGKTLDALAATIATALNVLGVNHVVLTGAVAALPAEATQRVAEGVRRSAMWARFGDISVESAPRRRALGLTAAAIDKLLVPEPRFATLRKSAEAT